MTTNGYSWPGSAAYLDRVFPTLRNLLTTVDLFTVRAIGWRGLFRFNRRLLAHRASVLADLLAERWGITGRIRDLPETPVWHINATSLHTGKGWRFSAREMGDWKFGRHYAPDIRLADAAAASAAVPYVLGRSGWTSPRRDGSGPIRRRASRCRGRSHPRPASVFGMVAPTRTWVLKRSTSPGRPGPGRISSSAAMPPVPCRLTARPHRSPSSRVSSPGRGSSISRATRSVPSGPACS